MENKKRLERYEIDNSYLREHLLQQEFNLEKKERLLEKSVKIIQNMENAIKEKDSIIRGKENAIKEKDAEIKKHLSSFRYQAGSCLYEATHSLKGFVLLPIKLMKLYIEYKKSK